MRYRKELDSGGAHAGAGARAMMRPTGDESNACLVQEADTVDGDAELRVRHMHRRDTNRVWEFLKLVFRDVNRDTVEFQRPRHKKRFMEIYEEEGIEQLVFEIKRGPKYELADYAEYAYDIVGANSGMNQRYFANRGTRSLFVEEVAVHSDYHSKGIGSFMFEQIEHAYGAVRISSSRRPKTTRRSSGSTASGASKSWTPLFSFRENWTPGRS